MTFSKIGAIILVGSNLIKYMEVKIIMICREYFEKIKNFCEGVWSGEIDCYYSQLGIRFENKERIVGDIIWDYSRTNRGRDDLREFPEFGTKEYDELEELDGVCAYKVYRNFGSKQYGWDDIINYNNMNEDINFEDVIGRHCYLLGCDYYTDGEDANEIVMEDAEVLAVIF